jgi:putative FmdB family regulatory protein
MPIFEYECSKCEHEFEVLVQGTTRVECPACHSRKLERKLSVFAAGGKSAAFAESEPTGACGTCGDPRGPGSCSLN